MNNKHSISVVIPVYNGSKSLVELTARISEQLNNLASSWEIIFVNDGSKDESWQVISEIAKDNIKVTGIDLFRNYGQHNAIITGIKKAKYDLLVIMDDDLQHPPEEIKKLIAKIDDGFDVVYGTPEKPKHNLLKRIQSHFAKWIIASLMGNKNLVEVTAFKAITKEVCEIFNNFNGDYVHIDPTLCWATEKIGFVVVNHNPRKYGKSNYNFMKLFSYFMKMVTGYSVLPLRIASFFGFFFMIFGGVVFSYVMWNYIVNDVIRGFTFIGSTIALFSGVQLFCLGIIGTYLAPLHLRSIGKPISMIRKTTGNQALKENK